MGSPQEKAILASISGLFNNPRFSDLTLKCGGHDFHVHRPVVCMRSPVLAAACEGPFQEAATHQINVTIADAETLKLVLSYLYTGAYDDATILPTRSKVLATKNLVEDGFAVGLLDLTDRNPIKKEEIVDSNDNLTETANEKPDSGAVSNKESQLEVTAHAKMITNTLVYIVADYYQIPDLKDLAVEKFRIACLADCLTGFAEVCVLVYGSAPNTAVELRSSLCSAIVRNAIEFCFDETFVDTVFQLPDLGRDVFRSLAEAREAEVEDLRLAMKDAIRAKKAAEESAELANAKTKEKIRNFKRRSDRREGKDSGSS